MAKLRSYPGPGSGDSIAGLKRMPFTGLYVNRWHLDGEVAGILDDLATQKIAITDSEFVEALVGYKDGTLYTLRTTDFSNYTIRHTDTAGGLISEVSVIANGVESFGVGSSGKLYVCSTSGLHLYSAAGVLTTTVTRTLTGTVSQVITVDQVTDKVFWQQDSSDQGFKIEALDASLNSLWSIVPAKAGGFMFCVDRNHNLVRGERTGLAGALDSVHVYEPTAGGAVLNWAIAADSRTEGIVYNSHIYFVNRLSPNVIEQYNATTGALLQTVTFPSLSSSFAATGATEQE